MNEDQLKGRAEVLKGEVKKAVGKIAGNKGLESKGKNQKIIGKVQAGFGGLRGRIKKAI